MGKSDISSKIKELKEFMKGNKNAVSYTFTMTKKEFNKIAIAVSNNFTEYRVTRRKSSMMPAKYRNVTEVKEWVELTISKN